jgi:hypothetical protein
MLENEIENKGSITKKIVILKNEDQTLNKKKIMGKIFIDSRVKLKEKQTFQKKSKQKPEIKRIIIKLETKTK